MVALWINLLWGASFSGYPLLWIYILISVFPGGCDGMNTFVSRCYCDGFLLFGLMLSVTATLTCITISVFRWDGYLLFPLLTVDGWWLSLLMFVFSMLSWGR